MSTTTNICPICNISDKLYIDSNETGETRFCLNCGYQTHTKFKINTDELAKYESGNPKIVNALKKADENTGQYWYPAVITLNNLGIIFPDGVDEENWKWGFAEIISIPLFERINYPIPGKDDEFYETRLDIENAKHFNTFVAVQDYIAQLTAKK